MKNALLLLFGLLAASPAALTQPAGPPVRADPGGSVLIRADQLIE